MNINYHKTTIMNSSSNKDLHSIAKKIIPMLQYFSHLEFKQLYDDKLKNSIFFEARSDNPWICEEDQFLINIFQYLN